MKDCVSLEVAQKLQKAGYESESKFSWWPVRGPLDSRKNPAPIKKWDIRTTSECRSMARSDQFGDYIDEFIPAPTATQLAEELPMRKKYLPNLINDAHLMIMKLVDMTHTSFAVWYEGETEEGEVIPRQVGTLPDALGLMMCFLLENDLIPEESLAVILKKE